MLKSQVDLMFRRVTPVKQGFHDVKGSDIVKSNRSELEELLFSPDPETRVPRSDIAVMMSADTRPEVANYIRDVYFRKVGNSVSTESADLALETLRDRGESISEYASRLQNIVQGNFEDE